MNTKNITPQEFAHLFTELRIEEIEAIVDDQGVDFLKAAEAHLSEDNRDAYISVLEAVINAKQEKAADLRSDIERLRSDERQ